MRGVNVRTKRIKQVLVWDVTLLPSTMICRYYYLYMIMGVWSKRISEVEVHGEQFSKQGGDFFDCICRDEELNKVSAAVLHSDN